MKSACKISLLIFSLACPAFADGDAPPLPFPLVGLFFAGGTIGGYFGGKADDSVTECGVRLELYNQTDNNLQFIYYLPGHEEQFLPIEKLSHKILSPVYCLSRLKILTAAIGEKKESSITAHPGTAYKITWSAKEKKYEISERAGQ